MSGLPWVVSEIEVVEKYAGKLPLQVISTKINRTSKAIKHKAAMLGLRLGKPQSKPPLGGEWNGSAYLWTQDEEQILKKLAPTMLSSNIGSILGRSGSAVREHAAKLSISLNSKGTLTSIGRAIEDHALLILPGSRLLTRENYAYPYDMEWQDKKINVKGAMLRFSRHAKTDYWNFRTKGTGHLNCDYFLCLGFVGDYSNPVRAWLIPSYLGAGAAIVISKNGHKHKFVNYEIEVNLQ